MEGELKVFLGDFPALKCLLKQKYVFEKQCTIFKDSIYGNKLKFSWMPGVNLIWIKNIK